MPASARLVTGLAVTGAAVGALRLSSTARYRAEVERLSGQVALVAGGSRGLGLLIAEELAGLGLRVVICARDEDELERARARLAGEGAELHTRVCDVSEETQVRDLVTDVEANVGPVEVLVTVAGNILVGPVEALTVADFRRAMDVTFWGGVYLSSQVLPGMRQRGHGHIATIASIGGRISPPHLMPYASAKFASVGYHEGLRAELAGSGVQVTMVLPGLMRTGSHVNADFAGRRADEFSWFGTLASLPVLTLDARRAARRIVRAIVLGRPELQVPAYAHLVTRVHGLMPVTTVRVLGLVNAGLPSAEADERGEDQPSIWLRYRRSGLLHRLTILGSRAADELNQRGTANDQAGPAVKGPDR